MSNEKLIKDIRNSACSCDVMVGWTCNFCRIELPKLRETLKNGKELLSVAQEIYHARGIGQHMHGKLGKILRRIENEVQEAS